MKKRLVTGFFVVLFIGVAIAPSTMADVNNTFDDIEVVEITIEICGIDGAKPHTVKLTKQESIEVENLIDSIKSRLDKVETREETIEIFNEVIVGLDKYGLVGDMSVEEVQKLVTGSCENPVIVKLIDRVYGKNQLDNDGNALCLIAGETDRTYLMNHITSTGFSIYALTMYLLVRAQELEEEYPKIGHLLEIIFNRLFTFMSNVMVNIIVPIARFTEKNPLSIGHTIFLGGAVPHIFPASGWIYTIGLNDKRNWSGEFFGQIQNLPMQIFMNLMGGYVYPGVVGFTGIKVLWDDDDWRFFYLGSALWAEIGPDPP